MQHLHILYQNLAFENKKQRQSLLKIRRYIGSEVNAATCECPLDESQWPFTELTSSVDSDFVTPVETLSQSSSVVQPKLPSLVEDVFRLSHQTSCKEKLLFQHH